MLTHFTRASREGSALDNLVTILRDQMIRGSARMVRGRSPAVCLFDAPLAELSRLLVRGNRHRYEPFGIALDRRYAFKTGARPVVYMPWPEARRILPAEELWRVVRIDLAHTPPVYWRFKRAWPVLGGRSPPPPGAPP